MPLQATSGAASYDAFGGGVPVSVNYIEDVFSTWLYTGTGATQTITNNINLSGFGGLTWVKSRSNAISNGLFDTARGATKFLPSNGADAQYTDATTLTSFNTNGFSLGADTVETIVNGSGYTYASWSFRKQPKFFDVVTYTGTGANRTIAHNLGSVPGCIIVKRTDTTGAWQVYHRSLANTEYLVLNDTAAKATGATRWNSTTPTSTVFSLGTVTTVNASGGTYVAYLFAHNAGGFGLTGTDNVISCGSYTGNGAALGPAVNLGYEPQWILVKRATGGTSNWYMIDNMRGFVVNSQDTYATAFLYSNTYDPEGTNRLFNVTSTGFQAADSDPAWNNSGDTYIYIAIRRGPMKVPTSGTSVFNVNTATYSANQVVTTGFPVDMLMMKGRTITLGNLVYDRLRGLASTNTSPVDPQLLTSDSSAETSGDYVNTVNNTGYQISPGFSGFSSVNWNFRRAPSFFDEVCYTGNGATDRTLTHNLGVAPELIIFKARTIGYGWWTPFGFVGNNYSAMYLESNGGAIAGLNFFNYSGNYLRAVPGASNIQIGSNGEINQSGQNFVAYLFATCAGVSKCTSFTGTGTLQTIDCGFTSGSRFVLIKRTDSTGDWYVWDSSRGLSSSTDPYLLLNSTAAEVTSTNWVDTTSTGFQVTAASGNNVNINGASYIALAIA